MRILVLKPMLPRHDALGACEQDHIACAQWLAADHDTRLLTRANPRSTPQATVDFYAGFGLRADALPYHHRRLAPARFRDPAFLDGASWQYAQPDWLRAVEDALTGWQPDVVWALGSYNWAGAALAKRRGFRAVIRSDNYEPLHMLDEKGSAGANRLRYLGKVLGERRALASADVLAAITPAEQATYRRVNPKTAVDVLPLCALPNLLRPPTVRPDAAPLRVFFMGSTYNVPHNRAALEFVVGEVVPAARQAAPGAFEFHILGSKVPADVAARAAPDLIFDGYVPDLDAHLSGMDIALIPSLFGAGMQQKVFEPLCRGLPTLTHARALAGYPFEDGVHVLFAADAASYVQGLLRLRDVSLRQQLARAAFERASALFGAAQIQGRVRAILDAATAR